MPTEGHGGPGLHTDVGTPSQGLVQMPVYWWDTKDWEQLWFSHTVDPFNGFNGVIPNKGSAGRRYDLPVEMDTSGGVSDAIAGFDWYNWPLPDTLGFVGHPQLDLSYPVYTNFMPDDWLDAIGGPFIAGGPFCFVILLGPDPESGFGNACEAQIWGLDLDDGWIAFIGDLDEGEMFIEWFDYVHDSTNFSSIRGPDPGWTGWNDLTPHAGKLLTLWQDSDTGDGDLFIDDHSLWSDITYGGVFSDPGLDRGDVFYKMSSGGSDISSLNDPDTVWVNKPGPPHEALYEIEANWETTLPSAPGTAWPNVEVMALFRGAPTPDEIREIKTAAAAGTLPFGLSPPGDPPWGMFHRNFDGDPTDPFSENYTVPAGVSSVRVHVRPACGQYSYRLKGVYFDLDCSAGDTITVELGGRGGPFGSVATAFAGVGGWPDGGNGGINTAPTPDIVASGGGGSTRILLNGVEVAVIAGSGGGCGATAVAGGGQGLPTSSSATWDGTNGYIGNLNNQIESGGGATTAAPGAAGVTAGGTIAATAGVGAQGGEGAHRAVGTGSGGGGAGGGFFGGGGGGLRISGSNRSPAGGGAGSHWFDTGVVSNFHTAGSVLGAVNYLLGHFDAAVAIQPL